MNDFGEMSATGVVLSDAEMREGRLKRGECPTCGIKCFKKSLFKSIPISDDAGKVLNGRCLQCEPLDVKEMTKTGVVLPAQVEMASEKDLRRAKNSLLGGESRRSLRRSLRNLKPKRISSSSAGPSQRGLAGTKVVSLGTTSRSGGSNAAGDSQAEHTHGPSKCSASAVDKAPSMREQSSFLQPAPAIRPHGIHPSNPNKEIKNVAVISETDENMEYNEESKVVQHVEIAAEGELQSLTPTSAILNDRLPRLSSDELSAPPKPLIQSQNSPLHNEDDDELEINHAMEQLAGENGQFSLVSTLQTANEFSHHPSVQERAAQLICNYILQTKPVDDDTAVLVENGGIKLMVSALMNLNEEQKKIAMQVCEALCAVCTREKIQKELAAHDAVFRIMKVMDTFKECEDIVSLCTECLGSICTDKGVNARRFKVLGGEQNVIGAMVAWSESVEFQQLCLDVIINLSMEESLQNALLKANAADQVSIAMIVFSNNLNLLVRALHALRCLCQGSSYSFEQISNSGAIDSIVSAMHLHRENPMIMSSAAWTLGTIAVDINSAKSIGECGGIDVITRALSVHVEDESVSNKACLALQLLSKYAGNHSLMVEIGVVVACIRAIQHHLDQVPTIVSCLEVLSSLSKHNPGVKVKIVENETLDSISMLMVIHTEHRLLQKRACSILCNLVCEQTLDSLLAIGVYELISAASNKFPRECMEYTHQIRKVMEHI